MEPRLRLKLPGPPRPDPNDERLGERRDERRDERRVERRDGRSRLKYKADLGPWGVVVTTFERSGWSRTEGEDWSIGWFNVASVRAMFLPETSYRFGDHQMVNHYPNHWELTRKDTMVKNIKRFMRDGTGKKEGRVGGSEATGAGDYSYKDGYLPMTYNLPADYALFAEEFKRCGGTWIMKPFNAAQGRGIFLVNKLSQLKPWATSTRDRDNDKDKDKECAPVFIICKYIENPLLIGGRKFDLRLYVLVTSFKPLRAYQYLHGFARFCNVKYSMAAADISNPFMHLTNVAIQKNNEDYNSAHGGKWHVRDLRLYLESTRGAEATDSLFSSMNRLIVHSLMACADVIVNDRHCFECYGYDLLIDDNLKPWLVEVNASPSLTPSTYADKVMKQDLIRDIYRVVIPQDAAGWSTWRGAAASGPMVDAGNFVVLYDEAEASADDPDAQADRQGLTKHEHRPGPTSGAGGGGGGGAAAAADAKRRVALRRFMVDDEADDGPCRMPKSLLGK